MSSVLPALQKQQEELLQSLVKKAAHTDFGRQHHFETIDGYAQFSKRLPIQSYQQIRPYIGQLKEGKENVFWPGKIENFAVSAGTSGKGKHLPLTDTRLQSDRQFMQKVALSYLKQRPNLFKLLGSHLSMPGSLERQEELLIGEISGFSALHAPAWLRWLQVVDPQKLTELSFQQKFDLLLEKALTADLRVITAVPSWILTLFQQVLAKTGKQTIKQVWPNLNLLVCGGVKLANYKPYLQQLAEGLSLDFIETYGASEGYIGFSDDLRKNDLRMITDNGVFFECVAHPSPESRRDSARNPLPLWQVEKGLPYGLVLSTNAGLWRYTLNDVIEFTSLDPLRFIVKGRVNDMLDEYGEALYIYEAEEALQTAVRNREFDMSNFSIAPVLKNNREIPYHHWYIQFNRALSDGQLKELERRIDEQLQQMNRHYAIRRQSDALGKPQITAITQANINRWKRQQGNAGAQSKLPRILEKNTEI